MRDIICLQCNKFILNVWNSQKYCSECSKLRVSDSKKASNARWTKKHPEIKRVCEKNARLKAHKLSLDAYLIKVKIQENKCAICNNDFLAEPCIDHDHSCCSGRKSCGECVRGLLCRKCNAALGAFQDDLQILKAAADYIERWRSVRGN
jgi:hypothetical protein